MERIHNHIVKIFEKLDNISKMLDKFNCILSAFSMNIPLDNDNKDDKMDIEKNIQRLEKAIKEDMHKYGPENKLQHYIDRGYITLELANELKQVFNINASLTSSGNDSFDPCAARALVNYAIRNYSDAAKSRVLMSYANECDIRIVNLMK